MTMFWRKPPPALIRSAVPSGERLYAIGDIHGRLDLLDAMLNSIDDDLARHPSPAKLIFLGDYVDRGPASALVIERLMEVSREYAAVFLKGNHETLFLSFLQEPGILDRWRSLGGLSTLLSYGVAAPLRPTSGEAKILFEQFQAAVPPSHRAFFDALRVGFICGDYLFVHAGLRPGKPLQEQSEDDLLWIREEFTASKVRHEKFVVHGHTPVADPEIHANRINIDTGAYATGRLSCLVLENDQRRFIRT